MTLFELIKSAKDEEELAKILEDHYLINLDSYPAFEDCPEECKHFEYEGEWYGECCLNQGERCPYGLDKKGCTRKHVAMDLKKDISEINRGAIWPI